MNAAVQKLLAFVDERMKFSPSEMLQFLMDQHNLNQGDLPEIGSQSLISKILHGERQLTLGHIRYLSKRFGVSPQRLWVNK